MKEYFEKHQINERQIKTVKSKLLKEGETVRSVALYLINSDVNTVKSLTVAYNIINFIAYEVRSRKSDESPLAWLTKKDDILSEEDLMKIPLPNKWKLENSYI